MWLQYVLEHQKNVTCDQASSEMPKAKGNVNAYLELDKKSLFVFSAILQNATISPSCHYHLMLQISFL